MKNVSRHDTDFLRFIAIILVLNSHLDSYYPIPYIGAGGAIGNSLFFALSSFGLFLSYQKKSKKLIDWYATRIIRIYPSIWIVLLMVMIPLEVYNNNFQIQNIINYCSYLFYPPPLFWFLQALMLIYIPIYYLIKNNIKFYTFLSTIIIYLVIYLFFLDLNNVVIERMPFKIIFYFLISIFGLYLAQNNQKIKYDGIKDVTMPIILIVCIFSHKYLVIKGLLSEFQIIQQALIFPIVYYLFKLSRSKVVSNIMRKNTLLSQTCLFFSNHTLEIFIVHVSVSPVIIGFNLFFPVNIIIFFIVIVFLSFIIKRFASHCVAFITGI